MSARYVSSAVIALWGIFLIPRDGQAMSPEQVKSLAGAALLDLRVDALLRRCGLPSAIVDTADASQPRQTIRWEEAEMKLSPMEWAIHYSQRRAATDSRIGWRNTHPGSGACLPELSGLVLHAKGAVGFLTVKKRADDKGYITSYTVPENLYTAHQVVGLTGNWKQGMPISSIPKTYGTPDEVLTREGGIKIYRYWVVDRQQQRPVSVHAVDFETSGTETICTKYTVHTSGIGFVQERFDALLREWERDYVLD
jgi:hypothetical protein